MDIKQGFKLSHEFARGFRFMGYRQKLHKRVNIHSVPQLSRMSSKFPIYAGQERMPKICLYMVAFVWVDLA